MTSDRDRPRLDDRDAERIIEEMERLRRRVASLDAENAGDAARLKSIFRAAPVGIGVVLDHTFVDINERICQMTGYTRGELLGQSTRLLFSSDDDFERVCGELAGHLGGLGAGTVEARWHGKNGDEINVLLSASLIAPDDEKEGATLTALDISERKRAAEQEQLHAAQLSLLTRTAMQFVEFPEEGDIHRFVGEKVREIVGGSPLVLVTERDDVGELFSAKALVGPGETLARLLEKLGRDPYGMRVPFNEAAQEILVGGRLTRLEGGVHQLAAGMLPKLVCTTIERTLRVEHVYSIGLRRAGKIFGTVALLVRRGDPLPDPRLLEAFVGQAAVAIERQRSAGKLRATEAQLLQSQKLEAIGRLAGGVAHDFNNLLGAIIGHVDLMIDEVRESDPLHRDLEEISRTADRAAELTRQLLAFGRKQLLDPRILDPSSVVERMENMLRRLIGDDIELVVRCEERLGRVEADPGQLEQVIMNLAINARDAMPDGGTLTVETQNAHVDTDAALPGDLAAGEYVTMAISDSGEGMDDETRRQIFEPFFTTKASGKGTGLGLSTAYGIIRQSGGDILVSSVPGEGSTFTVYLPRVGLETGPPTPRTSAAPPDTGEETVLLVEDESVLRRLNARILQRGGYQVLTAADGEEALHVAAGYTDPIHLLLTDVVMPRIGGRELAERLIEERPGLKVLFTSGHTDDEVVRRGVRRSEVHFVQKPCTRQELLAAVREALDLPPSAG